MWEYCVDDPINANDPTGLFLDKIKEWLGFVDAVNDAEDASKDMKNSHEEFNEAFKKSQYGNVSEDFLPKKDEALDKTKEGVVGAGAKVGKAGMGIIYGTLPEPTR